MFIENLVGFGDFFKFKQIFRETLAKFLKNKSMHLYGAHGCGRIHPEASEFMKIRDEKAMETFKFLRKFAESLKSFYLRKPIKIVINVFLS